jgi:hypothetical protein
MRWILLGLLCTALPAWADLLSLESMRIRASAQSGVADGRLDTIVPKLRKVFQFQGYSLEGKAAATVNVPGDTTMDLGGGNSLEVKLTKDGNRIKAQVAWIQDGKRVLSTGVTMSKGQPVVLGGVPKGNDTLIVTLQAK